MAIAAMAAAGWLATAQWRPQIPWDQLLTFLTAFAGWIILEAGADKKGEPGQGTSRSRLSPHDIQLSRLYRSAFPIKTREFLRSHDFGAPYHRDLFDPLRTIDRIKGVEAEFEHKKLDRIGQKVRVDTIDFIDLVVGYVGRAGNWSEGHYAVPLDHERSNDDFSDATWRKIDEVHVAAKRLISSYEIFERQLRRLAPEEFASGPILSETPQRPN
jgi:hypothetical protein